MLTSSRCLLGTMKMLRFCTAGLLHPGGPNQVQGAKAPRRLDAHFCARLEGQVAAPLLCTPLQPWLVDKLPAVTSLTAAFDQYRILIIQMPQEAHLLRLIHHSIIKGRRKSDKTFQNPSVLNLEGYQHSVPCIRLLKQQQARSFCLLTVLSVLCWKVFSTGSKEVSRLFWNKRNFGFLKDSLPRLNYIYWSW